MQRPINLFVRSRNGVPLIHGSTPRFDTKIGTMSEPAQPGPGQQQNRNPQCNHRLLLQQPQPRQERVNQSSPPGDPLGALSAGRAASLDPKPEDRNPYSGDEAISRGRPHRTSPSRAV